MIAYTKIFNLGHRAAGHLFDNPIEITEKVDGSQFSFGKFDGRVECRSKNCPLDLDAPGNLFLPAVQKVLEIEHQLPEGVQFFGETLWRPKHNTIRYNRVPNGHVALFGAYKQFHHAPGRWLSWTSISLWADDLGFEMVPFILGGKGGSPSMKWLDDIMKRESFLGGAEIEGIVFKNYHQDATLGGHMLPFLAAKFVSEKFKERNHANHPGKGTWEAYKDSYQAEGRWLKAVQHLTEDGSINGEPQDIPKLMTEVQKDIGLECKEDIKDFLWKHFGKDLIRNSTRGLPEWYKRHLAEGAFNA